MSFDVTLKDGDGNVCVVEAHSDGGTYVVGGIPNATLNITYNYSWFYYHFLNEEKGLDWLHEKKAKDCVKALAKAVGILGTVKFKDYWAPTLGNAGHALDILLRWATQHPEAKFEVM